MILSACGGAGEQEEPTAAPSSGATGAPTIGGEPPTTAVIKDAYTFRPTASDPDGDILRFTATRLPPWASLDPNTGTLTGTPRAGDERVYDGIVIRASDGRAEAALATFSIEVTQNAPGSTLLSWDLPTARADGTPLLDLAGYRIEYGREAGDPDHFLLINNPSISTYRVERLSTGRWHFAVIAFDARSIESEPSAFISRTIN